MESCSKKVTLLLGENRTRRAARQDHHRRHQWRAAAGATPATARSPRRASAGRHAEGRRVPRHLHRSRRELGHVRGRRSGRHHARQVRRRGAPRSTTRSTFTIADGGATSSPAIRSLITIAAGSGKYKLSAAAAIDGSQVPVRRARAGLRCDGRRQGSRGVLPRLVQRIEAHARGGPHGQPTRDALALLGIILVPAANA
jgi:hypothetical protein